MFFTPSERTLAETHLKLTKDEKGVDVDQILYRSMIGSLLYLTTSRPFITFIVELCARYQSEPKISHITQVKKILKYIFGTSNYGMVYCNSLNSMLVGYYDGYWLGEISLVHETHGITDIPTIE